MRRLLVLEIDEDRAKWDQLCAALEREGYAVRRMTIEGRAAEVDELLLEAFAGCPPDVLLADLSGAQDSLPLRHARHAINGVWGEEGPMPLVIALLSERHLSQPEWRAFADDFLMPPHSAEELVARISLLLFRRRHVLPGRVIALPGVTIDLDAALARDAEHRPISLTPREFDLLAFLAAHRNRFFPRDRLLDFVWGVGFEGGERTVDIHIRRLRAKLPTVTATLLQTRRGSGYGL